MKKITITKMSLTNFKGIRSLTLDFYRKEMAICGKNGLGKTTVFDAFTWLMFGKDSHDNKQFDIKTLDGNGVAIPQLPHEVSAVLDVDGERIELTRRFTEKWAKKRGEAEATFTGHTEERLYNNVPCSTKEWNEKIAAICPEQTFKFITNPKYFVSQKADVQRKMLFEMAGDVSDADVAEGNEDFEALLAQLTGKTLEEYKREVGARKKRIKAEVETLPSRIDERQREVSELSTEDFGAIEQELADKQAKLQDVEAQLLDISKQQRALNEQRAEQTRQIGELKEQRMRLESDIKTEATAQQHKDMMEQQSVAQTIAQKQSTIKRNNGLVKELAGVIEAKRKKQDDVRRRWYEVNGEVLEFDESDFVCPTCKRPLEPSDMEAKQSAMLANFNTRKAQRLQELQSKGKALQKDIDGTLDEINKTEAYSEQLEAEIKELGGSDIMQKEFKPIDVKPLIEASEPLRRLNGQIADLERQLSAEYVATDTTVHIDAKNALTAEIDTLKAKLANKALIAKNKERIAELERQYREQAQEIADLERTEFVMQQFSKARIEAIDERINSMFKLVKFKMFEQQINGGEVETCEATVNGVPYSSLNTAMQIWAGLDIISAISTYEGVTAPIYVDNAEAVNTFPEVDAQLIKLTVTTDDTLTIK